MIGRRANLSNVVASLLVLAQIACTTATEVTSPKSYFETHNPVRAAIVTRGGERLVMLSPRLRSDTLFGFDTARSPMSLPFSSILSLSAAEADRSKSIIAGVCVGVLAAFVAFIIF
jgi:hypothetical protein